MRDISAGSVFFLLYLCSFCRQLYLAIVQYLAIRAEEHRCATVDTNIMASDPTLRELRSEVERLGLRLRDLEVLEANGYEVIEDKHDSALLKNKEAIRAHVPRAIPIADTQQWQENLLESSKNRYCSPESPVFLPAMRVRAVGISMPSRAYTVLCSLD